MLITVHWCIWTVRNNMVFNNKEDVSTSILHAAASDLEFWRYRIKNVATREHLDAWRAHFLALLANPTAATSHV